MLFRCSNCGHDHDIRQDSLLTHPETGTLLGAGWFRDEQGLNHQSLVCLECGTVHATVGAPLKGLITLGRRMAAVKFYLPPRRLQALIDDKGAKALTAELGLKEMIVDELASRGFIDLGKNAQEAGSVS